MANRVRGEVELSLAGTAYTLRPTYQAIAEVEDALGCGFIDIVSRLLERRIAVREMAVVIARFAQASGHSEASEEHIGRALVEDGPAKALVPLAGFLARTLTGEDEADEDVSVSAEEGGT